MDILPPEQRGGDVDRHSLWRDAGFLPAANRLCITGVAFVPVAKMEQGGDVALLAVGSMVAEAIEVRDLLEKRGIHAALVNCRSVKPMDEKMLCQLANRPIVTMEEHVLTGGFGSVVCAFLSGEGLPAPMLSFGIPDTFVQHGRRDQLLKYLGLTPELMTQRIVIALKNGEKHQ